jgi:hypothetical protein
MWECLDGNWKLWWRLVLLQESSYFNKILNSNMSSPFTMETNVLDNPTTCAKSVGMGSSPNYFWYPRACDSTMCVEPKLRLLVAIKCTCYHCSFCMSILICWGLNLMTPEILMGSSISSKKTCQNKWCMF